MANRVTPARRAALDVLRATRRGELADTALARAYDQVPERERGWLQELTYGTLRLRGRIDHLLGGMVHRGLRSLEPDLLDILRLGAYQLLEMRSVPPYAAVSQAVEQAKKSSRRGGSGLVNGVLQRLGRTLQGSDPSSAAEGKSRGEGAQETDWGAGPLADLFPDPEVEPVEYLVAWGSHPRWLIERWVHNFGLAETRLLVEANNRRPELYLRPVGMAAGDAVLALAERGIEVETLTFAPDALRLPSPGRIGDLFDLIPAIVQDPAAGLVVRYAAVPEGSRIADLCAAPGGKALALAEDAEYLAAADIAFGRLDRLRENLDRLDRLPVGVVVADGRVPPFGPMDAVLADVPCTGTGTLRRHPDGRWRLRPGHLDTLVTLQHQILEGAASIVRPGGLLIYATCSLEPEENEKQVEAFLDRHPEFSLEPPGAEVLDQALLDHRGYLMVRPWEEGVDGAFAARMRRRGEDA